MVHDIQINLIEECKQRIEDLIAQIREWSDLGYDSVTLEDNLTEEIQTLEKLYNGEEI